MVPDAFSARTEEYSLQRRLYLYNRVDNATPATEQFLDYALSPNADEVIVKAGFIDLGVDRRAQPLDSARARQLLDPSVDAFEGKRLLAERRAEQVRAELAAFAGNRIASANLTTAAYGKIAPTARNVSDSGRADRSNVPDMLHASKELLGFVVAEYSDPSQMLQSDAVLLQIAERQRMLEQEIANATCLIGEGIKVDASRAQLKAAIPLYEVSLAALRNGLPEAGVAAPPTLAIDLWLSDISERWDLARPTLDAISAGGAVFEEDRKFIFEDMNKLTWMTNVTVGQYAEASKLQQKF